MKNAIITAVTVVTGFTLGGLIGHFVHRHSGKRTGGSFRESLDDNFYLVRQNFYDDSKGRYCVVREIKLTTQEDELLRCALIESINHLKNFSSADKDNSDYVFVRSLFKSVNNLEALYIRLYGTSKGGGD